MNQFLFDLMVRHHRIWQLDPMRGARADFTRRTLENISATGLDLSGAIFTNAKIFGCDFSNANLTDINASGATFIDSDFTSVNFKNAYMPRTDFARVTFQWTDLWNVSGDGVYIISLQLDGANVVYTSTTLQINCLKFDIKEIWWMTDEEVFYWIMEHTDEEKEEMKKWWYKWRAQIHQIVTNCPAKPVNNL